MLKRRLTGHAALVTDAAFRVREPDILCSSSADGTIRLWDLSVESSTPILTLRPPEGQAWTIDLCPTRAEVVCTDSAGTTSRFQLRWFNQHIEGNLVAQWEKYRKTLNEKIDESVITGLGTQLRKDADSLSSPK